MGWRDAGLCIFWCSCTIIERDISPKIKIVSLIHPHDVPTLYRPIHTAQTNPNKSVGRWIYNFMKSNCHVHTAPKDSDKRWLNMFSRVKTNLDQHQQMPTGAAHCSNETQQILFVGICAVWIGLMTFFLLRKRKGDILKNVLVCLFHSMVFEDVKVKKRTQNHKAGAAPQLRGPCSEQTSISFHCRKIRPKYPWNDRCWLRHLEPESAQQWS